MINYIIIVYCLVYGKKEGVIVKLIYIRIGIFLVGLIIFSLGISLTINVQHLGLHPWDVLNVALFEKVGLSIGTWNITIGFILICVSLILDRTHVKIGTFFNAIIVGVFVDFYLWLDFLPKATHTWTDIIIISSGIVIMGVGGGLYNSAKIGSGPRDGFMLSIADKTGFSIGGVRIGTELGILVIGLIIGGPVFVFTFIFTFIQSPIFQFVYLKATNYLEGLQHRAERKKHEAI